MMQQETQQHDLKTEKEATSAQLELSLIHICNIRGYQVYKKLDEDNWIEDYGDHFLMKFYFTEVGEDRIVMERYPFAQSSVHAVSYTHLDVYKRQT